MSGNPFRRPPQQAQPSDAPPSIESEAETAAAERFPSIDTGRRSSKVKRVRIATPPPLSPDSPYDEDPIIRRVSNESHEGSPPPSPQSPTTAFTNPEAGVEADLFSQNWHEDEVETNEEVLDNTRKNSETTTLSRNATGGVVNPFQRTLATMEGQRNPISESGSLGSVASNAEQSQGQMNVDSFKRMLLTGTVDSVVPNNTLTKASSSYFDRGNSGTPSGSQQLPLETSSDEEAVSPETPLGEHRDNNDVPRNTGSVIKPKPLPPKPRHGKLVDQQRTPQTVSFSDFTPTETTQPESKTYSRALPQIPLQRKSSDLDSSLSPPAAVPNHVVVTPPIQRTDPESSEHPAETQASNTPQKNPPPLPLTRRTGQAQSNRRSILRETASSNISSPKPPQPTSISAITEVAPDLKPSKAPPPPPVRRPGSAKQAPAPDKPRSQSPKTTTPDEPPNTTSSRSSSLASRNRISIPPPPPPPPRRRGSSKSSIDQPTKAALLSSSRSARRRASQEIAWRANDTHLERVAEGEDYRGDALEGGPVDTTVLADMDRLQAEVDALRARHRRGG